MNKKRSKNSGTLSSSQIKSKITKLYTQNPKKRYTAKQIIKRLKLSNSYDSVNDAMEKLAQEGILFSLGNGRYKIDKFMNVAKANDTLPSQTYIGKVDLTRSGAAYIVSDDAEMDIYVSARNTNGAYDGDLVKVKVPSLPGRRKPEGKIIEIIERKTTHILGVLKKYKRFAVVTHLGIENVPEVHLKLDQVKEVPENTAMVVEITDWGMGQNKAIWGKISRILEDASDNEIAMQSIIYANGFELEFPKEVLKEAKDIVDKISLQEIDRRRDFREITTMTIDPLTAKDFDDALSVQFLENDQVEIGIHIADVSHYVKEGSYMDKEALERSTSVYLVDRVVPMLPERLSNDLCSLNPNTDKLTFSASFVFDKNYKLSKSWFGKGIIHSDKRYVYEEAQEVINNDKGPHLKELKLLNKIAKKLRAKRFKQGSLNFESDEVYFELNEKAEPVAVKVKQRVDTHLLIEEFMLLANRKVAEYIGKKSKNEIPFVYRVHDEPDPDKLANFAAFAKEMGVHIQVENPKVIAKSFNDLALATVENPELKLLEPLAIRTMAKAEYSSDNIGHYGLAFTDYVHFTSPIRRYADVLVHRILEKNLIGEFRTDKAKLEMKCKHISAQERKATDAERESVKYKQVEFIKNHIGEEMEGVISGIIDRGLFVMLDGSRAEGMVSFNSLGESYDVAESRLYAIGRKSRRKFKAGEKVIVEILDADLDLRQIEFALIED
jgi:ribonuclease R